MWISTIFPYRKRAVITSCKDLIGRVEQVVLASLSYATESPSVKLTAASIGEANLTIEFRHDLSGNLI
jgi:hypothetical protein